MYLVICSELKELRKLWPLIHIMLKELFTINVSLWIYTSFVL